MAFPGQKSWAGPWLRDAFTWQNKPTIVVDAMAGGLWLTGSFSSAFGGIQKTVIGESFEPLRNLYSVREKKIMIREWAGNFITLSQLDTWDKAELVDELKIPDRFAKCVESIDSEGSERLRNLAHLWRQLRVRLDQGDPASYVVLQALSIGNSMRHGPEGHNVLIDRDKFKALIGAKRGRTFISPIDLSVHPDEIYETYEDAILSCHLQSHDAVLLLDPPYIGAEKIYPKEDQVGCGLPPIEMGMQKGYGSIVAFNYFSENLDRQFKAVASQYDYDVQMKPTPFKQRINNRDQEKKKKKVECCWLFHRDLF